MRVWHFAIFAVLTTVIAAAVIIGYEQLQANRERQPREVAAATTAPPETTTTLSRPANTSATWLGANDDTATTTTLSRPSRSSKTKVTMAPPITRPPKTVETHPSAATTARPKPPQPKCEDKGYITHWNPVAWEWRECQRPTAPVCRQEYPEPRWVDGEWRCFKGCDAGEEEFIGEDGRRWCLKDCEGQRARVWIDGDPWCIWQCDEGEYSETIYDGDKRQTRCWHPADCPDHLNEKFVSDYGMICVPPAALEAEFWGTAFGRGGVPAELQTGKWIGGLAISYGTKIYWFETDEEFYVDYLGIFEPGEYEFTDHYSMLIYGAAGKFLRSFQAGNADTHICYGHDCFEEGNCPEGKCGLIGSSDEELSDCDVFLWDTTEGLFFLMQVADEPACLEAYRKVAAKEMNQASTSHFGYYNEDPLSFDPGQIYYSVEFDEITLTKKGRDDNTWVSAKDFG